VGGGGEGQEEEGGEVGVPLCKLPQPGIASRVRLEKGCGARKQTTLPQTGQGTHCTISIAKVFAHSQHPTPSKV